MNEPDDGGRAVLRAVSVAAVALAGFLYSLTPAATFLDSALLDTSWRVLRKIDPRPSSDEMIIVGIDPATVKAIAEPPPLWHAALGRALARIAAAHPRAIALDFPLPERSYDNIRAGLDRALFNGLATAVETTKFVTVLNIDARTRDAKRIHAPFLALLGESRLGLGMLARDGDGAVRRFSLAIPTEDGAFPTLEGRICRALTRPCSDGLVNYALGTPLNYVSLKTVLESQDDALLERLFRGRIVFIGETQPFSDRVAVPVNVAAWETAARESPAIVVHAQSLRTALAQAAPSDASRPLLMLLLTAAALMVLMRDWRRAAAWAVLATIAIVVANVAVLRGGIALAPASALFALWTAVAAIGAMQWRHRAKLQRAASNFPHPP